MKNQNGLDTKRPLNSEPKIKLQNDICFKIEDRAPLEGHHVQSSKSTCEFKYCPFPFVSEPYWTAFLGQWWKQAPHCIQRLRHWGFPSLRRMLLTAQTLAHNPQLTHFSFA